ncbi:Spo0E family sporulation regulatory protein-aspartic acid phosphatase [Anaerobacillus isosaccharinicus]|uniref:Aspartyl-phosphate phosphatase Spo0E family protein n=1 Tax=Anaerobacillus isosaccharinicus TaxID=1532552 RepID=A0A1S2MD28_9BACI|nr:aspartyl-phosphate phosphatase Spo0E family protein [Anaerobacillus isosaccharinicus]MBA5588876.1 aspartyl-phosphate phosphatase Spo0E family protein [Anaerobacillus isosaccharinicus]QOY37737.1 aspartyl-phosphate phosphatase Spo0E family protein [Anaerobacillus isosaccharinicus]
MEQLLNKIEEIRDKMVAIGLEKGFSNEEVVVISQELDDLLNQYRVEQKLATKKKTQYLVSY